MIGSFGAPTTHLPRHRAVDLPAQAIGHPSSRSTSIVRSWSLPASMPAHQSVHAPKHAAHDPLDTPPAPASVQTSSGPVRRHTHANATTPASHHAHPARGTNGPPPRWSLWSPFHDRDGKSAWSSLAAKLTSLRQCLYAELGSLPSAHAFHLSAPPARLQRPLAVYLSHRHGVAPFELASQLWLADLSDANHITPVPLLTGDWLPRLHAARVGTVSMAAARLTHFINERRRRSAFADMELLGVFHGTTIVFAVKSTVFVGDLVLDEGEDGSITHRLQYRTHVLIPGMVAMQVAPGPLVRIDDQMLHHPRVPVTGIYVDADTLQLWQIHLDPAVPSADGSAWTASSSATNSSDPPTTSSSSSSSSISSSWTAWLRRARTSTAASLASTSSHRLSSPPPSPVASRDLAVPVQLTHGTVPAGIVDFVMQEEFARFQGFWISPPRSTDDPRRRVLYALVDEGRVDAFVPGGGPAPFAESMHGSVGAGGVGMAPSTTVGILRYPRPGRPNARTTLHVLDLNTRVSTSLATVEQQLRTVFPWWEYTVRAGWVDADVVWLQIMSREQTRMAIVLVPIVARDEVENGPHEPPWHDASWPVADVFHVLWEEASTKWIPVHSQIHFLPPADNGFRMILGSERDGFHHLYLVELPATHPTERTHRPIPHVSRLTWSTAWAISRSDPIFLDHAHHRVFFHARGHCNVPRFDEPPSPVESRLLSASWMSPGEIELWSPQAVDTRAVLSEDGAWAVCSVSSAERPPVTVAVPLADGAVAAQDRIRAVALGEEGLGFSILEAQRSGSIPLRMLARCVPHHFRLTSDDGLPIHGFLWLPIAFWDELDAVLDAIEHGSDTHPAIFSSAASPAPYPDYSADLTMDLDPTTDSTAAPRAPKRPLDSPTTPPPHDPSSPTRARKSARTWSLFTDLVCARYSHLTPTSATAALTHLGARYPTLLQVYGGPDVALVTNEYYAARGGGALVRVVEALHVGLAVVAVDGRGAAHAEHGRAFEAAIRGDDGTLGDRELADHVVAVEMLTGMEGACLDPRRVAVAGWSYGGYLALMALAKYPDVFRVAVAGAPVVSWEEYDSAYAERFLGSPAARPDAYATSSVLTYAHLFPRETGRLFLVHGLMDDNVHYARHTQQLVDRLVQFGIPHTLQVYPSDHHGLREAASNEHFEQQLFSWFREYL
ncbi:dipeptidylpeptidase [Allomyces arbusculus]|nr:dipeptidylpeptidase [Allomyces arbusculus]